MVGVPGMNGTKGGVGFIHQDKNFAESGDLPPQEFKKSVGFSKGGPPGKIIYNNLPGTFFVKAAASEGEEDAERIAKDISCYFKKKTSSENNTDNPDNTENTDSIDTDRAGNCTPEPSVETK